MANRLAGGNLPKLLAQLRANGQSWEDISRELYEIGVEVSTETLRKWSEQLGIPAKPGIAAKPDTEAVA
jgi:transposase-like protein